MTARGVVGRPIALQERWNRGDLATPGRYGNDDLVGAASDPVQVTTTSHSTSHTKGAWSEMIASTSEAVDGLIISVGYTFISATDTSILLDVGIGAAASEVVIAADIPIGFQLANPASIGLVIDLPVRIPDGSRVAVRTQASITSDTAEIRIMGWLRSQRPSPSKLVTMGANTGTSSGVTLTAAGGVDTKSAWTEIVAATAQPFRALVLVPNLKAATNVVDASETMFDVGVGSAGSEVVVLANQYAYFVNTEYFLGVAARPAVTHVPAGSRIAVRFQSSADLDQFAATVIGVPY